MTRPTHIRVKDGRIEALVGGSGGAPVNDGDFLWADCSWESDVDGRVVARMQPPCAGPRPGDIYLGMEGGVHRFKRASLEERPSGLNKAERGQ